jgi:hypothetical protein
MEKEKAKRSTLLSFPPLVDGTKYLMVDEKCDFTCLANSRHCSSTGEAKFGEAQLNR